MQADGVLVGGAGGGAALGNTLTESNRAEICLCHARAPAVREL
jgi:hypothetical protein